MVAEVDGPLARYRLLASAIAGRAVDVAPAAGADRPWTDGSTVFVAADASPQDRVRAIAVQAALLSAGSIDPAVIDVLARRPALIPRYLAVEGHRALADPDAVLPGSLRAVVDTVVAGRTDSPAASLELARTREAIADPPECFGTIRPKRVRVPQSGAPIATEPTAHVARRETQNALRELDEDANDGDDASSPDIFTSPIGGSGGIGRLLGRMFTSRRSSATGPPGADAPTHTTTRGTRGRATGVASSAHAPPTDTGGVSVRWAAKYPEWDVHRRRYRPDWCSVVETPPKPDELVPFAPPDAHALRRALARLGVALDRRHRQLQGDDIDVDAAVEARVETLAGAAPDEAVYIDTVRRRRDLSVLVLLDVSGSAAEPSPTGETVHDQQRRAAAALTRALHDLGDRVALYAFRSQGRSAVTVVPVKRFDDVLDAVVYRRLGGLVPAAYTRLGAAIRHGAAVVERDGGTPRRLLVVVSDGFAYDHGYEGAYGEADARRALVEARRRGTACLCLSVGAGADAAALRRVFGTAAHATIPRVEQLPYVVAPLFRSALRSSEAQRRVSQRKRRTRRAVACPKESRMTPGTRPYYVPVGDEEQVFGAAFRQGLSVLLKGPTGCGKTRFVEAMSYDHQRPLVTVACHDDLTTADLVGRYLLHGGETAWVDGPLTRAVREGAICYLDEIVEARQDTTVVLHPLADHRRQLPIDRLGVTLDAAPGFCLVVSYNPGYQSVLKDLKDSTRQRMVAIELDFPPADVEEKIVAHESGVDPTVAARLVQLGLAIRRLENAGLREVASTRVLVAAGRLVAEGLELRVAARAAVAGPLTDDPTVTAGLVEMIDAYFGDDPSEGVTTR